MGTVAVGSNSMVVPVDTYYGQYSHFVVYTRSTAYEQTTPLGTRLQIYDHDALVSGLSFSCLTTRALHGADMALADSWVFQSAGEQCDIDLDANLIGGTLQWNLAADTSAVLQYNIYFTFTADTFDPAFTRELMVSGLTATTSQQHVPAGTCLARPDAVSVFYNGTDITSYVNGTLGAARAKRAEWSSTKKLSFRKASFLPNVLVMISCRFSMCQVPGAYLVVTAESLVTPGLDYCSVAGFSITCTDGTTAASAWEAASMVDAPKSPKIWASGGLQYASFRRFPSAGNAKPMRRLAFPDVDQSVLDDKLDTYVRFVGAKEAFNLHAYKKLQPQQAESPKSLLKLVLLLEALVGASPTAQIKHKYLKQSITTLKECLAFKNHTDLFLQHYVRCSKMCMEQGLLQWNVVHKHHLLAHMADQAQFLNPKYVTTYTGETMVGFMASLEHACLNGTPGHIVPEKVCWRFRLGLWFRLTGLLSGPLSPNRLALRNGLQPEMLRGNETYTHFMIYAESTFAEQGPTDSFGVAAVDYVRFMDEDLGLDLIGGEVRWTAWGDLQLASGFTIYVATDSSGTDRSLLGVAPVGTTRLVVPQGTLLTRNFTHVVVYVESTLVEQRLPSFSLLLVAGDEYEGTCADSICATGGIATITSAIQANMVLITTEGDTTVFPFWQYLCGVAVLDVIYFKGQTARASDMPASNAAMLPNISALLMEECNGTSQTCVAAAGHGTQTAQVATTTVDADGYSVWRYLACAPVNSVPLAGAYHGISDAAGTALDLSYSYVFSNGAYVGTAAEAVASQPPFQLTNVGVNCNGLDRAPGPTVPRALWSAQDLRKAAKGYAKADMEYNIVESRLLSAFSGQIQCQTRVSNSAATLDDAFSGPGQLSSVRLLEWEIHSQGSPRPAFESIECSTVLSVGRVDGTGCCSTGDRLHSKTTALEVSTGAASVLPMALTIVFTVPHEAFTLAASMSSLRSAILQQEPNWRNIRDLPEEERLRLEKSWDGSHSMHYSRRNHMLTTNCRDYFDRPRVLLDHSQHSLGEPLEVTWKLPAEPRDWSDTFGRTRKSGFGGRSCSGQPEFAEKEAGWNDRHHVLHAAANHEFHESDKEYFSLFLQPRNKRVVPKRQNGITKHVLPYRKPGQPDGGDDGELPTEILLKSDDRVPIPAVPGSLLRQLTSC
ncbi:unnamed protein product [Effrenium voratum]|uniref:Uncharacterized protein n=1 Tax=Effrenium voratum TaxID=2562239 RepID=A0AA36IJT0_9DINO|nr:unnamed protein product [Effrenium voratum]